MYLLQSHKWQSEQTSIDLSSFAQGIYIIKVYDAKTLVGAAKISKLVE